MSAEFITEISIKANKEDLIKLIKGLYDFKKHSKKVNKNNYAYFEWIEVKCKNLSLDDSKISTIKKFVADCGEEINISAIGPYGYFYELSEVKLFEYLAEVAPRAYFKGSINGFSGSADQNLQAELKDSRVYIEEYYADQGDAEGDGEYGQYVKFIKRELPYSKFCKLFKINKKEFDEESYNDFINDMMDDSLLELDYERFSEYGFGEINEDEFEEAMSKIADLNLITFDEFMCEGYFDEDCGTTTIIYDPIKKEYLEDSESSGDDFEDEEDCDEDEK